jgi:hypothetical protein
MYGTAVQALLQPDLETLVYLAYSSAEHYNCVFLMSMKNTMKHILRNSIVLYWNVNSIVVFYFLVFAGMIFSSHLLRSSISSMNVA